MGNMYAYVRVSTQQQNEDRQVIAMAEVGVSPENIYIDKQSGKHYLRFVLKVGNAFEMVLNRQEVRLDKAMQKQYDELCTKVSVPKLNNYLNRQVRKRHVQMHSEEANGFALTERAYRYANHGIYITMKEKRKRIFIPLTDNNSYNRQIYMKLYPEQRSIELQVPLYVEVKKHTDYTSEVGLAVSIHRLGLEHLDEGLHIMRDKREDYLKIMAVLQ